ncbi:MAG TPA: hypothetical protein VF533_06385 [Solirubrobacteraceae bacterium]
MENEPQRPARRMVWVAAVAAVVGLGGAVSAFAGDGPGARADTPSPARWQARPVQEAPAAPQGERPGPGGRDDCPEKDGEGRSGDGGSQDQAAPTAPSTTPEL